MDFQRDQSGRLVGLEHRSGPLQGGGGGKSVIEAAGKYVCAVAEQYGVGVALLKRLDQRVTDELACDEREELRSAEIRNIRSF